jgi:hypothetical protein
MAPLTNYLVLATVGASAAFSPAHVASRPSTRLSESFGFDFAEDSYANTPDVLLGEANYKQWVKRVDENSFLNRKVCFKCLTGGRYGTPVYLTVCHSVLPKVQPYSPCSRT